jgi:hypothetical protein
MQPVASRFGSNTGKLANATRFDIFAAKKLNSTFQEKRTLNFVFQDDIPEAVRHSVAENYFLQLNAATSLSKDAVEFLMNSLVLLRDLPHNYIRLIDIKVERVAQSDELVIPTLKECGLF